MSGEHQFDSHPDADQIGAFVEHALPAHERERMFAHLAVCPECREIVALSLPEVAEPAAAMPAARKPWWTALTLAWSGAAVLAAVAGVILYVHRPAVTPGASPPSQMAAIREPAANGSQPQPASSAAKPAAQGSPAASAINRQTAAVGGAAGELPRTPAARPQAKAAIEMPTQNRNFAALKNLNAGPQAPQAEGRLRAATPATGSGRGTGSGSGSGYSAGAGGRIVSGSEAQSQQAPPAVAAATPASAAPTAPPPQSNRTVEVSASALSLQTTSPQAAGDAVTLDELQTTPFIPLRHALPSRQPVLSMAARGRLILAIDLQNAVFLSADAGKHWKPVTPPWPGRAVKADVVSFPLPPSAYFSVGRASIGGPVRKDAASTASVHGVLEGPGRAPVPGASLSGNVTDPTGAVIAGASVEIANIATQATRTATTDAAGHYMIDSLAPGIYRERAVARGFSQRVVDSVQVSADRPAVANLSLTVGAATESVTVETANMNIAADKKAKAAPAPAQFAITTDNGDRWTSTDGLTWKHE